MMPDPQRPGSIRPASAMRRCLLDAGGRRLAALLLAACLPAARAQATETAKGPIRRPWPVGKPLPATELPVWEGSSWRLSDQRGQVVVMNFWASWCEPCRAEMPSLELLAARHERDGLQVVAINHRETDAALRRYLAAQPTTLSILRDADGELTRAWGVRIFPSTLVIDRRGRAAFVVTGECDWTGAQARAWLAPLLA